MNTRNQGYPFVFFLVGSIPRLVQDGVQHNAPFGASDYERCVWAIAGMRADLRAYLSLMGEQPIGFALLGVKPGLPQFMDWAALRLAMNHAADLDQASMWRREVVQYVTTLLDKISVYAAMCHATHETRCATEKLSLPMPRMSWGLGMDIVVTPPELAEIKGFAANVVNNLIKEY